MSDHAKQLLDGANKCVLVEDYAGARIFMLLLERELERSNKK